MTKPEQPNQQDLTTKAISLVADILTFARTEPMGKDASHFTKRLVSLLTQEYKNGYNQRLKDEGKTGVENQNLYL